MGEEGSRRVCAVQANSRLRFDFSVYFSNCVLVANSNYAVTMGNYGENGGNYAVTMGNYGGK